jgi:hypothetical protein
MTFSLTALCRTIKCDIPDHIRLPLMVNAVMAYVTVLIVVVLSEFNAEYWFAECHLCQLSFMLSGIRSKCH